MASEKEHHEHHKSSNEKKEQGKKSGGFVVKDATYLKECGACHFAYQPDLLPTRSWEKLMGGLDKHFGENAELSQETQKLIAIYLTANSADSSTSRYAKKFMGSLKPEDTPLRISEIPYFVKEHRKVSKNISENEKVKSISFCNKCHTDAETGGFAEHKVKIPQ